MTLKPPFNSIPAWLIDMDGVIYRGATVLPGAIQFIQALQDSDRPFLFLTNNASKTPEQSVQRLASMGIEVSASAIFTSALATAAYLTEQFPAPRRVLILGGPGIQLAVREAGYDVVTQAEEAEIVVNAMDQDVTYAKLTEAALAIGGGCPWIATNSDPSLPTERGNLPGTGSIIALLSVTTDREPEVIGKPEARIFEQALARLGAAAQDTVMVGDRLTTDILGGHQAGIKTLCVLTGIASRAEAEAYEPRPDWIVPDLKAILI